MLHALMPVSQKALADAAEATAAAANSSAALEAPSQGSGQGSSAEGPLGASAQPQAAPCAVGAGADGGAAGEGQQGGEGGEEDSATAVATLASIAAVVAASRVLAVHGAVLMAALHDARVGGHLGIEEQLVAHMQAAAAGCMGCMGDEPCGSRPGSHIPTLEVLRQLVELLAVLARELWVCSWVAETQVVHSPPSGPCCHLKTLLPACSRGRGGQRRRQ